MEEVKLAADKAKSKCSHCKVRFDLVGYGDSTHALVKCLHCSYGAVKGKPSNDVNKHIRLNRCPGIHKAL